MFHITRSIRRAQGKVNKGVHLKCGHHKAGKQIARRRRLSVMAKASRKRNR